MNETLATSGRLPVGLGLILCLAQSTLPIKVATYKPATYQEAISPFIVVHHGILRDFDKYRDHAMSLADQTGALVLSPQFDKERFPGFRYTMQEVDVNGDGKDSWPFTLINQMVQEVKGREEKQERKVDLYIMAHSGGSQMTIRSLYRVPPIGAKGIVLANAGSWLFPCQDLDYPYGLGGLKKDDTALKKYLALPLVVMVGLEDVQDGNNFDSAPGAMAQGATRLDRGRAMVAAGQKAAEEHGWRCRWSLVEVPGVGHDGGAMLTYAKVGPALFGKEKYAYYTRAAASVANNASRSPTSSPEHSDEEEMGVQADGSQHHHHERHRKAHATARGKHEGGTKERRK